MPFAAAGAGIGAIGSIVGGGKQASAEKTAAQDQLQAATQATQLQQNEFNTVQQNEAPYLQAGYSGLSQLQSALPTLTQTFDPTSAGLPSQFTFNPSMVQNDPAYQFAVSQGTQALQRTAAAQGNTLSAATNEAVGQYVAGTANQFYNQDQAEAANIYQQNYGNAFNTFETNQNSVFNKLAGLAQIGAGGNAQVSQAGQNFANNASANTIGAGNAQAASTIGQASALNSGFAGAASAFSSMMNNPSFQSMMKNMFNSGSGSTYNGGIQSGGADDGYFGG